MAELSWQRLRRDRETRGLSQRDAVLELIAHAPHYSEFDVDSVLKAWKRWESGSLKGLPTPENQLAIARTFGTARDAFFVPETSQVALPRLTDDETLELVGRLRSSSLDESAVDLAWATVDQLCSDYASKPNAQVLADAQRWLQEVVRLRDQPMSYRQHGEIYGLGGWLSLLVACLQYDRGDERAAVAAQKAAVMLGEEIEDVQILGWGAEIDAWMALTQGDHYRVIHAAKRGLARATHHPVSVQLHAQSAKAWARLGNRRETELSLETGRSLLDALPYPDNPRNHFQVDPSKYDFYAMDCYRELGDDTLSLAMAKAVQQSSVGPDGSVISPMRLAEAELTLAAVEARAGEVESATELATAALARSRRSVPSLLMVGAGVAKEMSRLHPHNGHVEDFARHVSEMARANDE